MNDYARLVDACLRHTHGMSLPASECQYVAACEVAKLSPRVVAEVIARFTKKLNAPKGTSV